MPVLRFLNGLFGALIKLIIFSPLILIGTALVFFLFVDRLLEGKPFSAVSEVLKSPFKAMLFLYVLTIQVLNEGWEVGLVQLITTSLSEVRYFFTVKLFTNSDSFLSTGGKELITPYFEGSVIGAGVRKLMSLLFSHKWYTLHEDYEHSPHNPVNTITINTVYEQLSKQYNATINKDSERIHSEITSFITEQAKLAETNEDKGLDSLTTRAAVRCLERLKTDSTSNKKSHQAVDVKNATAPLSALYLVWCAISELDPPQQQEISKKLLIRYLSYIQRGLNGLSDHMNTEEGNDAPECPTGALSLILEVLQAIPDSNYKVPLLSEQIQNLRAVLNEKLNQTYYTLNNTHESTKPEFEPFIKAQVAAQREPLKNYARLLFHGGSPITKTMKIEQVEATSDAVCDAWEPPTAS